MELPLPSKRHHQKPRIGSKYQVDVPSFKSSCRIKSHEATSRDHLYACGLAVPVTRIAVDSQSASRKRKLSTDQASCSNASTVNSRSPDTQEHNISNAADIDLNRTGENGSKDAYSCASSSKEKFVAWNQDCATTEDGCQGEEEGQTVNILPKKRRKKRGCKRSCWQPKRRVSKKPRLEIYSAHCVEEEDDDEEESDLKRKIVPGARPESWSQAEAAYFRLAIFLLGKRFCEISKFIGTKKVIDVSDYYYSKFFGRPAWARWKASKSFKCKIAVRGELILEGWRQVELLRRIKPVVSDDAHREIIEAASAFNVHLPEPHPLGDESKVSEYLLRRREKLDTYVFKLKEIVGLELFEKCVGIGGPREGHMSKRDLTSGPYPLHYTLLPRQLKEKHARVAGKSQDTSFVPGGSENFWPPPRSEDSLQSTLSVGENWLRKRSNNTAEIAQDFWERVWPALERGGWRTIERKMSIRSSPKLLFLRPGVDKLHREERGISYFDNLNGVIEAVKEDPSLRQLAEDPREESDAPDDEEAAAGGWSDDEDMFTTLDGKRTIVPPTIPSARARAAEDSSQSSSLDLNREMSAVNSKPQVESGSKNETSLETIRETQSSCEKVSGFPLGGIDLNLLPADEECVIDAGPASLETLECEFLQCSSIREEPEPEPEPVSILVDVAHPETELTLSLGNFTNHVYGPYPSSSSSLEYIHEASVQPESAEKATGADQLTTPLQSAGHALSHHREIPSRKRSLSYQGCDGQGDWFDNGKELVSLPKKRAITLDWIPRGLGELPVTNLLIRMNKAALVQFCPQISSCVGARPDEWWRPTSVIDMKLPFEGLPKAIQDSASQLLSSARRFRGRSSFEEALKAWHNSAAYGSRSSVMAGFREPRCKVVDVCPASEDTISRDEQKNGCVSEFAECRGNHEPMTVVSSQQESPHMALHQPACYVVDSPNLLMGSSHDVFQDERGITPRVTSSVGRGISPIACFRGPTSKAVEANTNFSDEQERVSVPQEEQQEEAPARRPQIQFKTIRFHVKDRVQGPIVAKERSKRVPRTYSSGTNLPKPKAWLRRDHGEFTSVSGSLNSCLTTDSFPVYEREKEEPPHQSAQLRVKSEDNDMMETSPSSSVRSWGTGEQDEEILSEDHEEEKPFRPECRTSREMYSASVARDIFDSSLYKPRKRRCDTPLWPRTGSQDCYLLDSEKRLSSGEVSLSDPCEEISEKRVKVSHEDAVLESSSPVGDMFRESYEGEAREDDRVECASAKTKDKRSKPRHQIRNVSCERFVIMLYTERVEEEELPVESRSPQGPFLAPSHLPHLRGARPNKVRQRRRPSLPCRTKKVVLEPAGLRATASASPKRSVRIPVVPVEVEAASAAPIVKWPEQDGRFSLRRASLDLPAKSGRPCRKRGGPRWQHCCSGC